ncbi:ClpP family protease [Tannockella kyphosi]|uniref:ClpP family protease n=1 Tax=Tannockella kyphosi TaxID=2899121 RepID=UPI0020127C8E|nr:ATP-dependent Clp protease proteolytic subunit [Tannockella kyphosi]
MNNPKIVKETHKGLSMYSIQDDMLLRREIECIGEINTELVNSLISQIRYLYSQDKNKEITIFINSPGGCVSDGLALYDIMNAVQCPIRTVCIGMAASMGAILFASGDTREILPHARVMIHDPLINGNIAGSALQIRSISEDLLKTREVIASILSNHTGKSIEDIYEKTITDTYFYAQEAIDFGLADTIIHQL